MLSAALRAAPAPLALPGARGARGAALQSAAPRRTVPRRVFAPAAAKLAAEATPAECRIVDVRRTLAAVAAAPVCGLQPWSEFLSPEAFTKQTRLLPPPTALGLAPPASFEEARARLVCNTLRFAPNYAALAAAAAAASALTRPLDLALCAALSVSFSLVALCANAAAFDAAWPRLHPFSVFEVDGVPIRVDGVAIKLNGRNVGNETRLWGLPKQLWAGAAAALCVGLVALNPLASATLLLAALGAAVPLTAAHATLKPLPQAAGDALVRLQVRVANATAAPPSAPAPGQLLPSAA